MSALPETGQGELQVFAETDDVAALCFRGEFDMEQTPLIVHRAERLLAGGKEIIVDLSDATFVDSRVVDALVRLRADAERKGRTIVLQFGTAELVERVIEISDSERVLPRARTRADALGLIRELQPRRRRA